MRPIVAVAYPQVVLVHAAVTLGRVGHLDPVCRVHFVLVLRLGSRFAPLAGVDLLGVDLLWSWFQLGYQVNVAF